MTTAEKLLKYFTRTGFFVLGCLIGKILIDLHWLIKVA